LLLIEITLKRDTDKAVTWTERRTATHQIKTSETISPQQQAE
jgi:hypothetical protein